MGGVENIQMAYFLPFGAGLIALHTISILFVSRISLIKRLFLVVWVMLFAIGAPFLFQQVPGIAFVGLCALALAVYMVLLFSQELAPVKKRATASARSRSQKHAKSTRKKAEATSAGLSSARDLNLSNASTGRMRKESKERVQAEESPARQRVSASGRTLADRSIKKDMTRFEKVKPLYPVDNLATAPAFGEYEPNSQLAAAEVGMVGMDHSSQKANDEFLQSLLHHRKGATKIKVANSLIQPTEANAAGNQGYTDIDDPAFETAVLSKIRPMSYTESSYGNFRPQAVEVTSVVSQDEEEFFTDQDQAQQPVAEEVGNSLEDVFAATGDIKPVRAEESRAANSLESLFFAEEKAEPEAQMDSVFSQASAKLEFSASEESMVSRDRADIQGYQDILSQIQHDLLGSEEDLTDEVAQTWEEESSFEPAAETFEFEEVAEPAVVQSVSEDTLWTQAEPVQEAVADETEEDLLKGITDILKAEEAQIKAVSVAPAADETEEDLLQKITDILKAEEAAEAQPAAATAGDKEVYFQFLLLESQELLASNAVQEAESYLKEIVQGSSDQNLRQEAFNMLDKIGKN